MTIELSTAKDRFPGTSMPRARWSPDNVVADATRDELAKYEGCQGIRRRQVDARRPAAGRPAGWIHVPRCRLSPMAVGWRVLRVDRIPLATGHLDLARARPRAYRVRRRPVETRARVCDQGPRADAAGSPQGAPRIRRDHDGSRKRRIAKGRNGQRRLVGRFMKPPQYGSKESRRFRSNLLPVMNPESTNSHALILVLLALLPGILAAQCTVTRVRTRRVVELYTSEGCSSCRRDRWLGLAKSGAQRSCRSLSRELLDTSDGGSLATSATRAATRLAKDTVRACVTAGDALGGATCATGRRRAIRLRRRAGQRNGRPREIECTPGERDGGISGPRWRASAGTRKDDSRDSSS